MYSKATYWPDGCGLDDNERIPDKKVERVVLAVTIERLLNHDIALRERLADGDYLVFPSNTRAPLPIHVKTRLGRRSISRARSAPSSPRW